MQDYKFKCIWPMSHVPICNCLTLVYDHPAPHIVTPNNNFGNCPIHENTYTLAEALEVLV